MQVLSWARCGVETMIMMTLRDAGLEERKQAIHKSLHKLWTNAVGTEGYVKDDWMDLERNIHRLVKLLEYIKEDARESEMKHQ